MISTLFYIYILIKTILNHTHSWLIKKFVDIQE